MSNIRLKLRKILIQTSISSQWLLFSSSLLGVAFRLGRVSNLPTVWTNCLAGALLSGNFLLDQRIFLLLASMSLLYIAGMFLNDAFDHALDAKKRPYRPIPSGQVSVLSVFTWGGLLMFFGLIIIFLFPAQEIENDNSILGLNRNISAICLCLLILLYDWKHKENPFGPYIMGLCRGALYITAGLMYSPVINTALIVGAVIVFLWTIGLTFLAKQEALNSANKYWPVLFLLMPIFYGMTQVLSSNIIWLILIFIMLVIAFSIYTLRSDKPGKIGLVVSTLIASLSLLDGLLVAISGFEMLAVLISLTMFLTLFLQKYVSGT